MRTATASLVLCTSLTLGAAVTAVATHSSAHTSVGTPVAASGAVTWTDTRDPRASRSMRRVPVRSAKHSPRPHSTAASSPRHTGGTATSTVSSRFSSSWTRLGDVTMYCLSGTMADGQPVHQGAIATLDRSIPFGTHITVPGLGTYVVEDRVGWGTDFDVWTPSCATADRWGRHHLDVRISR